MVQGALKRCESLRYTQGELLADLLDKAAEYLPYLHQKPHVLVLDHPLSTWMAYKPEVGTSAAETVVHRPSHNRAAYV